MKNNKDLKVFLGISFILPYLMSVLMVIAKRSSHDINIYPIFQMFVPALGLIFALKLKDKNIFSYKVFKFYFITTIIIGIMCVVNNFIKSILILQIVNLVIVLGTLSFIIFVLREKEISKKFSIEFKNIKLILLFGLFYYVFFLARFFIFKAITGEPKEFNITASMMLFRTIILLINFFFSLIPFFGEEYGWRAYLAPKLQNKFGAIKGLIITGLIWGIWHLPLNLFFYSVENPTSQIYSILNQLVFCIIFGIFLSYSYYRTKSIFAPVLLHYLNNNMAILIMTSSVDSSLQNSTYNLASFVLILVSTAVVFLPFLFTKYVRDKNYILKDAVKKLDEYDTETGYKNS